MSNVIFLDYDGVVYPSRVIGYHPLNRTEYPGYSTISHLLSYWKMDDIFIHFWNHINDVYDFRVVVSSTWKTALTNPEYHKDLFDTNGAVLKLHDDWKTPDLKPIYPCMRASEIHAWISKHPEVNNYLIIDDVGSGHSLLHSKDTKNWNVDHYELYKNTIVVDEDMGLSSRNMSAILKMLKGWK